MSLLWLAVTIGIISVWPAEISHRNPKALAFLPAAAGILGLWVSVRLLGGRALQFIPAGLTLLLWIYFLHHWFSVLPPGDGYGE